MDQIGAELGLSLRQASLVVIAAVVIYVAMVVLSRIFGQRQFLQTSTYDLAFAFALGTLVGRVILVRTTLLAGVLGLVTMFSLHAGMAWLHHHSSAFHRLVQNRPVLLAAHGHVLEDNLRRSQTSHVELYRLLRLQGHGSLEGIAAAILEPSGQLSVLADDEPLDAQMVEEVVGVERLGVGD